MNDKKNTAKSTAPKAAVKSPVKLAYAAFKQLNVERKAKKAELVKKLDALWAEYRAYVKDEYKPARKAKWDELQKLVAEKRDARAAKKAAAKAKAPKKVVVKTRKEKQIAKNKAVLAKPEAEAEIKTVVVKDGVAVEV